MGWILLNVVLGIVFLGALVGASFWVLLSERTEEPAAAVPAQHVRELQRAA